MIIYIIIYLVGCFLSAIIYNIIIINLYLAGEYKKLSFREVKEKSTLGRWIIILASWLTVIITILVMPSKLIKDIKKYYDNKI